MYHEKQIKELCALHALNNLFQDSNAFSKAILDNICCALSPDHWLNPHKSLLGTGNYDINVIMAALTTKECGMIWFDKRKDPSIIVAAKVVGFILNVPSEYRLGPVQLPLRRKHWIAIRSLKGIYYNLDSKLEVPEVIGKEGELTSYIREELRCKDKELFIVVSEEVDINRSWCSEHQQDGDHSHCLLINSFSSLSNSLGESGSCGIGTSTTESEKSFSAPGLKYIDQEPSSLESSQESFIQQMERNSRAS